MEKKNRREWLSETAATVVSAVTVGAAVSAISRSNTARAEDVPTPEAANEGDNFEFGDGPTLPTVRGMPQGNLCGIPMSRVFLGGNLITGYMHARDLRYVEPLFRAYATEEKMIETLKTAEENGINVVFETGGDFVKKYNTQHQGSMQFIPHIEVDQSKSDQDLADHVQQQIDTGAYALYVWGVSSDQMCMSGAMHRVAKIVEIAKKHDLPVGVGSHSLQIPIYCEKEGVPCDFYVKTLHRDDYPSAVPKEKQEDFMWYKNTPGWYDNQWCIQPEEVIAFMQTVRKPWVAFKVLAAGAIAPETGLSYAFAGGADFVALGMLDFQIRGNVQIANRVIRKSWQRERPWFG